MFRSRCLCVLETVDKFSKITVNGMTFVFVYNMENFQSKQK